VENVTHRCAAYLDSRIIVERATMYLNGFTQRKETRCRFEQVLRTDPIRVIRVRLSVVCVHCGDHKQPARETRLRCTSRSIREESFRRSEPRPARQDRRVDPLQHPLPRRKDLPTGHLYHRKRTMIRTRTAALLRKPRVAEGLRST
jgi:hypothetical protein